jgi:hypothetical protein
MEINRFIYWKIIFKDYAIGFSILGNLASKAVLAGIIFIVGAPVCPLVTAVVGLLGGIIFGAIGSYAGNKIADKKF